MTGSQIAGLLDHAAAGGRISAEQAGHAEGWPQVRSHVSSIAPAPA